MKFLISFVLCVVICVNINAQHTKIYNEDIDRTTQIKEALSKAKSENKYVICQVGGNWCVWCLRFAKFISEDAEINKVVQDNFIYIHVNYPSKDKEQDKLLMIRFNNAGRFGYPVLVVLDADGNVMHLQDSGYLENGQSYDKEKVLRFFNNWSPKSVKTIK
ncbi:MAG: thioredoxin family protein [Bacteroidaceae bacterium]|nr:thioredoxin family protein [Bacteroidaceae bacterium]